MKLSKLLILSLGALGITPVQAETNYYVSAETGSDENDGLSWETATASIQHAIDISSDGDTIIVTNGIYSPISFGARRIESVNGPLVTIIDANNLRRCVTGTGTNVSSLAGFWVRNGQTQNYNVKHDYVLDNLTLGGAGVFRVAATNCLITDNICLSYQCLWNNDAFYASPYGGGAAYSLLQSCSIFRNQSVYGGGGYDCVFENCTLEDNIAGPTIIHGTYNRDIPGYGGGACGGVLKNCTLRGNRSFTPGMSAISSTLINCLLLETRFDEIISGRRVSGGIATYQCNCYNCTFGNTAEPANCYSENCLSVSGSYPWTNYDNISTNCLYVELDSFVNPRGGDYHLVVTSPAVDAGDSKLVKTDVDADGNPRIMGRSVDVGCFECTTPKSPSISSSEGFRFVTLKTIVSIVPDADDCELYYAINDGEFVSANAQSIDLTTTETIRVRAYVLAYDRFQSEIVEADIVKVEPCAVVEGATATWNEAETEVAVEWTVQPEAFTYAVYRGEDDDFANATQLTNNLESCRYVDEPGDSDLVYYYWVVGENELGPGQVGEAVATRWAQVATPTISPEDGTRFGTASKKVMFSCSTPGVKFHYTTDGSAPTTNSPAATAFTLRDTATVKVIAAKSRMRPSEVAEATITRIYIVAAPILGVVHQVGEGLQFGWTAVNGAESYEVYRGRSPDFAAAVLLGETEKTEWLDGTVDEGVPYYYFVLSKNLAGVSADAVPELGATLTLASSLNSPQLKFTTSPDCPWNVVATGGAYAGKSYAKSGTPGDSTKSSLETVVTGPGVLTFQWRTSCEKDDTGEMNWDHLAFSVDGSDEARLDGKTGWEEVCVDICDGEHVLLWSYVKDEGIAEGSDCGCLDYVQWIPDNTKDDWESWIKYYGLASGVELGAFRNKPSGKGDTLYEEFVAGVNPLDKDSRFRARIDVSSGQPVISWNPDLGDVRRYTVEGKSDLANDEWGKPTQDSRFFRVSVRKDGE